jgi:hypothetical protein
MFCVPRVPVEDEGLKRQAECGRIILCSPLAGHRSVGSHVARAAVSALATVLGETYGQADKAEISDCLRHVCCSRGGLGV